MTIETKKIDENSFVKYIYNDGFLISEQVFVLNDGKEIPNGYHKVYFKNGGISEMTNWYEGQMIGTQTKFFQNGNISSIFLLGGNKKMYFEMRLDSLGTVMKIDGIPVIANFNKNTFHVNDTLEVSHLVIETEKIQSRLSIKFQNPKGEIFNDVPSDTTKTENNTFFNYYAIFANTGIYIYEFQIQLIDIDKNRVITTYSFADTIVVKK